MGHFLEVAYRILSIQQRPLSAKEITDWGGILGLLKTNGRTPEHSMRARLSSNILNEKEQSLFVRVEGGLFALKEWGRDDNIVAPRFKKALLDEDILVLPKESLFKYIASPGLHAHSIINGQELIQELYPMPRKDAECDYSVIQLVSAFIIHHNNRYLTFKRTKRLPENRLHGYYSVPFGGHLNSDDVLPMFDIFDPKIATLLLIRELTEEIVLKTTSMPKIEYKGLLYDDRREISRQHLAVVYDVYFENPEYTIGERGFFTDSKFETLEEMRSRIDDFENWSQLIIDYETEIGEGYSNRLI